MTGSRARDALAAVDAIADELRRTEDSPALTLHGGDAGVAIFFAQLAAHTGRVADQDTAIAAIDRAGDALGLVAMDASLYAGFSGIAWAIEHLAERLFEDVGDDDASAEVDVAIARHLSATPYRGHFDLVSGLVGFGVYALERRHRTPALLETVVERLDAWREEGPGGRIWFTHPEHLSDWERDKAPAGFFNLGLAHGVPGIIALLGHAVAAGVGGDRARAMLDDAVAWVLAQQLPPAATSRYPWWTAEGIEPAPARTAWCYGDPGVAAALLIAAHATGDLRLREAALNVAREAAMRPLDQCAVEDAGLCHGGAGLLHIFNRTWQATGDDACRRGAVRWLDATLSMRGEEGVAGFRPHADDTPGAMTGLLTGAAGIGLALLAATTPIAPTWDRMLLVDIPSTEGT